MIAPTLLIGLGGTGSKIVLKVANLVNEEQRRRIAFAVFDTDINELRDISENNPFIYTIQTSTKMTVGEYLNIDTHARDNWFPVNPILNSKTLTEGAGQVRAVSRLALDTAIRAGMMEPLHKAVESLYKLEQDQTDQALRVVIVSSLAGGTGSGLILPVALYLRHYLATRFQQSANIVRGFFILPEVFYEVIHGQTERNNLKCNAYATLRELDAFLMKGDGTLPHQFDKSVKIEFPRIGSKDLDEYNVRPYDFCFLFDAQNTEGRKLNEFNQYLDHAANCIFAQSIGPMNKRSNSSEDNTIRDLARERGRNRYAGAGSSMLLYPVDDVRDYVAIKWTQESVSHAWLCFDKQFYDKKKKQSEKREQGIVEKDIIRAEDYIATIDSMSQQKDPFARNIIDQCKIKSEDGLSYVGNGWDMYVEGLKKFVEKNAAEQTDLDTQKQEALAKLSDVEGGSDTFSRLQDAYRTADKYRQMVERKCEDISSNVAYTIFQAQSENVTAEKRGYQLETYLRDSTGSFIHPNAVRYFIYQALNRFKAEKIAVDNQLRALDKFFKEEIKSVIDDPDIEGDQTIDQLTERKQNARDKLKNMFGKVTDDQQTLKDSFSNMVTKADEYRIDGILRSVIDEGIAYLTGLCEAFEQFYDNFEQKISGMSRRLTEISRKYVNDSGKTTRYVCASKSCLDKLVRSIPYMGSNISVDGKLADNIYSKVREYAMKKDKPRNAFNTIFEEGIIAYFQNQLMSQYGDRIDMDIISAMEREIELESGEEMEPAKVQQLVHNMIENTRKLADPFIERPLGEQTEPISACTYNPCIDPGDDSPRATFVGKELKNFGATPDKDIGKNMIMFYRAIYGLRANRLSKFAPAVEGGHCEGEYFKAYYELVNQIIPKSNRTPVITPHIDCNWHVVANLPDLDDVNQKALESKIYRAFMYGLIYGLIDCTITPRGKYLYKLRIPGKNPEEFVVSNKTPCDEFYEVLDALTINPVIVDAVLNEVGRLSEREIISKTIFDKSRFSRRLNALHLNQYEGLKVVTIFDLATLLKVSTPATSFENERGVEILKVMLDSAYDYMKRLISGSELDATYGKFIVKQFLQFDQNLDIYRAIKDSTGEVNNYLDNFDFIDLLDNIQLSVREILELKELENEAELVQETYGKRLKAFEDSQRNGSMDVSSEESPFDLFGNEN